MISVLLISVIVITFLAAVIGRLDKMKKMFWSLYWLPPVLLTILWLFRDWVTQTFGYAAILLLLLILLLSLFVTVLGIRLFWTESNNEKRTKLIGATMISSLPMIITAAFLIADYLS